MDTQQLLAEIETIFPGDPQSTDPSDPRWQEMVSAIGGFTSANELAVLNLAAKLLPADEVYLEVGTFKGRSLCAAVQDAGDTTFYALENYLEFGMLGQEARDELTANLARWGVGADVRLVEADCFRAMVRPDLVDRPVGVYFYDGAHTLLNHWLALGVVEPLLADEALVLVDDATWKVVQRAHSWFLRSRPGWEVVRRWDAAVTDDPRWANGLHVLVYRRPAGTPREMTRSVRVLRRVQLHVFAPLERLQWNVLQRTAYRHPKLLQFIKRLVPKRSRSVD